MTSDRMLPDSPRPLALNISIPMKGHVEILAGYESQGQGDPWSWRFVNPWVEVWRPNFQGLYCFAVRFEEASSTHWRVAEAWFRGDLVTSPLGPDPSHALKYLLECFGGYDPEERLLDRLSISQSAIGLTFSGLVRTEADVDDVAMALKRRILSPGSES